MIDRRQATALALGLLAATAFTAPAAAQSYPDRPVTLVVTYPPGGPTDAIGRIVAEDLSSKLGQNVVVRNEAGASGSIGTRSVATGEADGYTFVLGNNQTHGNNMYLLRDPGYDALEDFVPLAGIGAFEHVYVVRNDLEAQGMQDLIAMAKADPEAMNYGSTGIGSGSHLSFELFLERTGTEMTHIPSPARAAGAGARRRPHRRLELDAAFGAGPDPGRGDPGDGGREPAAQPQPPRGADAVGAGRRGGGGGGGGGGADAASWAAFFAPAGIPDEARTTLSDAILASLAEPAVAEKIGALGFTLDVRTPDDFRPYHEQEMDDLEGESSTRRASSAQ